ncbi:hypothetical protein Tco_1568273 [Tanacetum coccineum]
MSYLVPLIAVVFVVVVGCYLASVPQEEDHQYVIAILGLIVPLIIVAIGVEAFWKKAELFDSKYDMVSSMLARLLSTSFALICNIAISLSAAAMESSSLAITSSGLSSDASDAGLPSEKVVVSGKNSDGGDLLLFQDGLGACDISARALRLASQVFLEWSVLWRFPVPRSCQIRCIARFEWLGILCLEDMSRSVGFKHWLPDKVYIRGVHIILGSGAGVDLYVLIFSP